MVWSVNGTMRIQALLEGEGSLLDGLLPKSLENEPLQVLGAAFGGYPGGANMQKGQNLFDFRLLFFNPPQATACPWKSPIFCFDYSFARLWGAPVSNGFWHPFCYPSLSRARKHREIIRRLALSRGKRVDRRLRARLLKGLKLDRPADRGLSHKKADRRLPVLAWLMPVHLDRIWGLPTRLRQPRRKSNAFMIRVLFYKGCKSRLTNKGGKAS